MKEKLEEMKSNKSLAWGILVLIIIFVLIFAFGGKKDADKKGTDATNEESEMTNESDPVALSATSPIETGDYKYDFSGVEWIFDTEDPQVVGTGQTYLKMMFADFTRNGNPISFGRPYKLGFHPGTCESVEFLDTTDSAGIPIAYATCTDGKVTRNFAVLQDAENVTVKMKEVAGEEMSDWQDWYKINITEIVK